MRLFKPRVLRPSQVEGHVVSLEPRALNWGVPDSAINTADHLAKDFKLDDLVIKQTGLSELQKKSLEEAIDTEVLKRLKEVEERAYSEAHKLGQEEGKKEAFNHYSAEIQSSLEKLTHLVECFEKFKNQMLIENEEFFIKLVYHIAKKITLREINQDPSLIKDLLTQVLNDSNADSEIVLKISKEDLDFIKTLPEKDKRLWENNKLVKIEAAEGISRGGCVVETNFGIVDAQVEQRLQKAWSTIEARVPKVNPA
ncbi:MAG: hypothetical protein IPM57_00190 [Oligoflexia bacterium]|nr:hypothetical protein [Oligoflexia bacterium]